MSVISLSLTAAALVMVAVQFQLRVHARRAGIHHQKERWMVFGVLAGAIAMSGAVRENGWVSLIGFLLAGFGIWYRTPAAVDGVRAKRTEAKSLTNSSR